MFKLCTAGFKLSNENTEAERPVPQKNMIFNFLIPGHGKLLHSYNTVITHIQSVTRHIIHRSFITHSYTIFAGAWLDLSYSLLSGKRTKSTIMNTTEPVLRMALHLMAKVYKFKLSKENKMKAERHRVQVRHFNIYHYTLSPYLLLSVNAF